VLSFTQAASELGLTQGAISHQVRELESRLGARLFERGARGIALTEAGRRYLPFVRQALDDLRAGEAALGERDRTRTLTVTLSPNFATKWLVPRLGRFLEAHPDLDLRISASLHHVDFAREDIDLAIRHGDGGWPGLRVDRLAAEDLFPVCSPALLADGPAPERPEDLARFTLLHDRDREGWRRWFAALGSDHADGHGPVFSQTSLAIDAAVAGQGVALARSALAALDLAAGRLVRPIAAALPAGYAYWIVCPKQHADRPAIRRFRSWLLEQADGDRLALSSPNSAGPISTRT